MELAAATGARGNSTALVGTPDTVAAALLEYYKLGATSLLIRGYDPRRDAVQYSFRVSVGYDPRPDAALPDVRPGNKIDSYSIVGVSVSREWSCQRPPTFTMRWLAEAGFPEQGVGP